MAEDHQDLDHVRVASIIIPAHEPSTEKLLIGISRTLGIPREDIQLFDSFVDLGGDKVAAEELEERMLRYGVRVSADEILSCKTIAELQTHGRYLQQPSSSSPSGSERFSEGSVESTNELDRVFTPTKMRDDRKSAYGPTTVTEWGTSRATKSVALDTQGKRAETTTREEPEAPRTVLSDTAELERFLSSTSRGEYYSLIKVAAGPFRNRLVAFISAQNQADSEDRGIHLPPEREYQSAERQIKNFCTALREWQVGAPWPNIWIPLHSMVTKSNGEPATRALQWWLKNLDEDLERRILSFQPSVSPHPLHQGGLIEVTRTSPAQDQPYGNSVFEVRPQEQHLPRPMQRLRGGSRGQPDILAFKPEPIPEEDEPEEGMEVSLEEARAVSLSRNLIQAQLRDSTKSRPRSDTQQDSPTIQHQLSTTRPERTLSKLAEGEPGKLQVHEHMGDTLEDIKFFPLSTMQQLFFRTSMNLNPKPEFIVKRGYRFSQSILLRIRAHVDFRHIETAVEALVERHSMLRARFRPTREGWAQAILSNSRNYYRFDHHQTTSQKEISDVIEKAHSSINPIYGPVFAAEHILSNNGIQCIFLTAHHLAVDLASWRVIIHDLDGLLQEGTLVSNSSTSFPKWLEGRGWESNHNLFQPKLPFEIRPPNLAYWGLDLDKNRYGNTHRFQFSLNPELTYTLNTMCRNIFRTEPGTIFLTALLLSFCQTFPDRDSPTMWTQEDSRDIPNNNANIDDTVGWFTSLCPISLVVDQKTDIMDILKLMKDTRKAIPNSGIPFFNTEFLTQSAPSTAIPVEIMFSCVDKRHRLHRDNGILEPVAWPNRLTDTVTSDIGPDVGRIALFEVSVAMDDAGVMVEALYVRPPCQDRIELWMKHFESLATVAIRKLETLRPELTLADAPLLKTNYQVLSKLSHHGLAEIGIENVGDIEAIYPVNPSQQEFLVSQSLDPESFWVSAIYELSTLERRTISQERLCAAWSSLVASHMALRSVFISSITDDGLFDQVVLKKISPDMLFLDSDKPVETLGSLPAMKNLPGRPSHRLSVCKAATKTYIRVDANQAICDSVSIDKLVTRLRIAYADEEPTPADNTPLLQTWLYNLTTADTSPTLQSWQTLLADAKPCNFPSLSVKPDENQTPRSEFFSLDITCRELHDFCIQRDIVPAYVLQLAWGLVLRAYVGMDHVSFGYEVSGRVDPQMPGIKEEIGSFAALSPCTVDLAPNRTLIDCLNSLADVANIAKQGANPTIAEIQHAKKLTTDRLFNTCLSMRDFDNARHKHPELDMGSFRANLVTSSRLSNCNLSLSVMFIANHLHVDFSFRSITQAQAQNLVHTFERATRLILNGPGQTVSSVDLFTDRDYAQLVVQDFEFNVAGQKANTCIHQLILLHAQTRPEAPAICSWDGNMTYYQVAYCVATLATYLRNIGVMPGLPVPVVLEKSKWAPVIMLAVLKAGGSIVCLDAQDQSMIEATVKQLNCRIVVATESAWNDIACIIPNLVIVNERFFSILPPQVSIPVHDPSPDHGACVIYTPAKSKSSSHRALFFTHSSLCSALLAQGSALKLSKGSRVLQVSAFNVDVALVEILGTMVHGGCVCIPSAKDRLDNLAHAMAGMGVTWSYMTSTLSRRIDPAKVPKLKTICFRTRQLDEDTRKRWLPNRTVLMAYGAPDVCPLGISISEVSEGSSATLIPQPLMGRFWILNPEDPKKLMPLGAVGELAIDCPMLTPHKFSPSHLVVAPPGLTQAPTRLRYLKTGHRVRYLEDGSILFISSMRDDIFIDGTRISVFEVERRLRSCFDPEFDIIVESAATGDSVQILATFLELGGSQFQDCAEFDQLCLQAKEKKKLATSLRRASITIAQITGLTADQLPSVFIPLRRFPTSNSLKVNRRKLQKMVSTMTYSQLLSVSAAASEDDLESSEKPLPLAHVEDRMRRIWAAALDIYPENIRSNDTFLGLGGDMFLASRLMVSARRTSLSLPIKEIMKGATLTQTCQAMAASEISPTDICASEPRGNLDSFGICGMAEKFVRDCIAPQMKVDRHDIIDVADASAYQVHGLETQLYGKRGGIKCLVFNFNGPIRSQKLQAACDTLTRLHPVFRTAFWAYDRRVYQVLLDSFRPKFQRHTCPAWSLDSVADKIIAEDQEVEFKPQEPATKFTFLDAGNQSTLIVRLSCAQIEESVVALLVQDLAALYEMQGSLVRKPNFFEYMRAAHAANNSNAAEYWAERLKGAKMTEFVSHYKPYAPVSNVKTLRRTIQIGPIANYGFRFGTVLKAAWAIVLAQYAASSDVVFGEVTLSQNVPLPESFDLSSMIAPTSNTTPVRVRFSDTRQTPLDFLNMIQEHRAAARPHEALGILELVQRCTNWPYWTRFSTVVHHRHQPPVDGAATLNMGDTTFTYSVTEPVLQDMPDILVLTTMDGPQTVDFELKYSESRVPTGFAEDALRVLTMTVDMLTSHATIEKPMVQSAAEIARFPTMIPLASALDSSGNDSPKSHQALPTDERRTLKSLISAVWTEVLDPKSLGVPDTQVHKANFYDLWGSILPAQSFAERLNAEFAKRPIKGLHKVRVTPAEIVEHPSMAMQHELIVRKIIDAGIVSGTTQRVMSWSNGPNGTRSGSPTERKARPEEQENGSLRRSAIGKLRGLHSSGSVWGRRRRSVRNHHSESDIKGIDIGEPVATGLPPRAMQLRDAMNELNVDRASPTQNEMPAPLPPQLALQTNLPIAQSKTQELPVSPMSASPKKLNGELMYNSEQASPVSPLGPAWLAV